jgi:hypothetical protein
MPTTYAIPNGATVMDATLWTGDGATSPRSITNTTGFKPDLVWTKDRTSAYNHQLFDSVRGTGSSKNLMSNSTDAEGVNASSFGYLSGFNSNGFALTKGSDPGNEYLWVGKTSDNYVAWQWKAGGTAVSNTSGSITSSVSANTTAGFSIVTWTGDGSGSPTIGHGLGATPSMIIIKNRSGTSSWPVYHSSLTNYTYFIRLDITDPATNSGTPFGAAPTSTTFTTNQSVGTNNTNVSGNTYVAYCWTPIAGFSQFGSYTGNSSSDGPFIYTGFRPKFVMIKRTDAGAENWNIEDTSRSTYNQTAAVLYANTSGTEQPYYNIDILSNGLKIRTAEAGTNTSGSNYIYACFAENPFKYANAR